MNATIIDNLTRALDSLANLTATVENLARQAADLQTQLLSARDQVEQVAESPYPGTAAAAAEESVSECRQSAALLAGAAARLGLEAAGVTAALEDAADVVGGEAEGEIIGDLVGRQAEGEIQMPEPMPDGPLSAVVPTGAQDATAEQDRPADADGCAAEPRPLAILPDPAPAPRRGRKRVNPGAKVAGLLIAAPDGEAAVQGLMDALKSAGRIDLIEALARVAVEALPTAAA